MACCEGCARNGGSCKGGCTTQPDFLEAQGGGLGLPANGSLGAVTPPPTTLGTYALWAVGILGAGALIYHETHKRKSNPTGQPEWKFVQNLGDASPLEHGGMFLYHDTTGQYPDELEKLEMTKATASRCSARDADDPKARWEVHRITLDRLKLVRHRQLDMDLEANRAYLVPYSYKADWPHPLHRYEEWFAKDLGSVASSFGTTRQKLVRAFCSADGRERAWAYMAVADHDGWANFDGYPLKLTRAEVETRYTDGEL